MSIKLIPFSYEVIPWSVFMFLVCLLLSGTYADNPCKDGIYLEVGTEGVVPCEFTNFDLVGWINGNGNYEETSPFIYLENSQVKGRGFTNGDYDIHSDGSLVIKNVQLTNDRNYTALYVPTLGPQEYFQVSVRVFVRPDPEFPVINGHSKQQHIVQDVMSSTGSITCTLNGARPAVPLEWEFQSDVISVESEPSSNTSNNDGTYNTLLSSRFTIVSHSVTRVTLKCKAAGELAHLFPLVTTIYLQLARNYPVVNGQTNQPHVVIELEREDKLTCFMSRAPQDVLLQWVLPTQEPSHKLMLQNETSVVNNEDGTANITLTSRFSALSPRVRHVTLQCVVIGQASNLYPDVTTVEILFTQNFPVVNGHSNQPHVVVELEREDTLTCFMSRVPQDVLLQWVLPIQDLAHELMLQNETSVVSNEDGTANITLTSRFSALSPSIRRVTLECRVSGQEAEQYPDFTTVDVLLSENYPVVNGHSSDGHILLHLKREDELNCSMNGVSEDVSLEWAILTPDVADEIILEDKLFKTSNEDGTFDIRIHTMFTILSNDVQHVTMQCRVSGQSDDQYKEVTTVEVLIAQKPNSGPLPLPVIDGCYSQQEDCTLIIRQDGTLTCYVPNIPSEHTMDMSLDIFADSSSMSLTRIKSDQHLHTCGDYDLITSYHYSVDEASTVSAIYCSLSIMDTGEPLNSSTASLIVWQETQNTDINISHWTLAFVIPIFPIMMVLTVFTFTISKQVGKLQKQPVRMYPMQDMESEEGTYLRPGYMNGSSPNSYAPSS